MNLRNRLIVDLDQSRGLHVSQESHDVAITGFRVNLLVAQNDFAKVIEISRLLKRRPDQGANLVEAIIHAGVQVQNDGFARQITGDLIWHSIYDRELC
jgi:hypothetical protein